MNLQYSERQNIIYIDKPEGHPLSALQRRLPFRTESLIQTDDDVSGAHAFFQVGTAAPKVLPVRQHFWFLTSGVSDFLEKENFHRIKRSPFFELWETRWEGSIEALRKRAGELGILPMFIHRTFLQVGEEAPFTSAPPRIFERLGLLVDAELVRLMTAIDARQRAYNFLSSPLTTLRLSHLESQDLRLDLLGPVLWGHWYANHDPAARDLQRLEFIAGNIAKTVRS